MESTGSYWKPVYNIFEEEQIPIMVVNAQHIKGVPGRKTDVKDAEWIADLVRHGLVKASYIPNRDQRELREITRYRQEVIEERARAGIRNKQSYLYSRYQRIAARRGGKRALIAVAHTMLIAIYHILKEKVPYHDLGADYYSVINQEKIINRNIRTLEKLGVNVMIQPK